MCSSVSERNETRCIRDIVVILYNKVDVIRLFEEDLAQCNRIRLSILSSLIINSGDFCVVQKLEMKTWAYQALPHLSV